MTNRSRLPGPAALFAMATGLLAPLAGCLGPDGPRATTPGADFPLQLQNNATHERLVDVRAIEPISGSAVLHQAYRLPPGAWGRVEPVRLPYGAYRLAAASGDLVREVETGFRPDDSFFRFVVHDDVIAFQRG